MTLVVEALQSSRGLVTPPLRDAVDRLDPHTRLVVSYHLGWCDAEGKTIDANPGKAVRPTFALLTAEGVAGAPQIGLPGAVAVELVHNFSLLHDDLMDRDAERRHRPTVWSIWGDATAILAGDALLSLAHEVLAEAESPQALAASHALAVATRHLVRGQAQDVAFETRDDVTLIECLDMAAGKTGSLLEVSATIGAILGGAQPQVVDALSIFGAETGMAFQLVDDVLGIWGSPQVTGKPVHSDLQSRKKSLPVTWTIENGGAAGRELADWLADREVVPDPAELPRLAHLIEAAGGRQWALDHAAERTRTAEQALAEAGLPHDVHRRLAELGRLLVERTS